ncbi:MAG: hypothetical protein ABI543_16095 [Ignavibacteria bacterium]
MKSIITLALLLITLPSFSQSNRIYSVAVNGGGFFPVSEINNISTGYNIGIDIESRKNNFGLFLGSKLNFLKYKYVINLFENGYEPKNNTMTIGEITAGGRWYWGHPDKLNANLDLGLGIYTGNYYQKPHWGIQPGIGGNVLLTKNLAANLNVKVNVIEVEDWETYAGIYLGLRYSFNK